MELFLPSLVILLLAGVVVFGVMPRISPFVIVVISVIFLFIAVHSHYVMFNNEYKFNLFRDQLQNIGPAIMITVIVLGIIISLLNFSMPSLQIKQLEIKNIETKL